MRHGAVVGLAEVMLALHGCSASRQPTSEDNLSHQQQTAIAELPCTLERAKFLKGKGGELMKSAICR